jgi:2-phospho-L-lactate guanylyltransferase (CobY/MobA/RfbA family)
MLGDVLEASAAACLELGLAAWLAVHPPEACPELARLAPPPFRAVAQRGSDLAARMEHALRQAAAAGFRRILLRGSDSPELAPEVLGDGLRALDDTELVIRPGLDGGYDLIGLRAPVPGLFQVEMGTRGVLAQTLARAARAGLSPRLLEPGGDLDTAEDLLRLLRSARGGRQGLARRSLAWLERHPLPEPSRAEKSER